jgi:hypothetical protein
MLSQLEIDITQVYAKHHLFVYKFNSKQNSERIVSYLLIGHAIFLDL